MQHPKNEKTIHILLIIRLLRGCCKKVRKTGDAIDEWFMNHKAKKIDTEQILKDTFSSKNKTIAFLAYNIETPKDEDSKNEGHNAFLRLNDGKTPLTSSELIKALYMVQSSGLTIQQQMEISKEWELIENNLQNEQFWLMFNAEGLEDTPTRIDLLFALVLQVSLKETKANPRIVFDKLEDDVINFDLSKVWDEVLHIFWWMQSCYLDVELCNYLSWIRAYTDISATTIYGYWRKCPAHKDFKNCIIKVIQDTSFGGSNITSLDSVNYGWDKGELRKLFVLLNVIDCNKCNERFRFDLFNQSRGWDIEHIDSQTPNNFTQDKNKKEWLKSTFNELSTEQKNLFVNEFKLAEDLESFDITNVELDNFDMYAEYIVQLIKGKEDTIPEENTNKLGNLALLNLSINRSYKNDIFPLKRKYIIDHINSGAEFIPPCTVKAFMKFYTKSASRITSWQKADYDDYYDVMNSWLIEFMDYDTQISNNDKKTEEKNLSREIECSGEIVQMYQSKEDVQNQKNRYFEPISFPDFMDKYDVIIPKIQRLYVQGRLDKRGAKCLSDFASRLVDSVSTSSPLLLDFIYGIDTSNSKKNTFYPLDGQQRLTTLLLLSWLCGLSKPNWTFKYESRRTTEVFIKELLASTPPQLEKPDNYEELKENAKQRNRDYPSLCKEYICSLPWFHESWLCDTGICGMIEMLDSLYDKLLYISKEQSLNMNSIVFLLNYLDVSTKSYDHIFLKMNSRGKELTEWDNVNAVLDEASKKFKDKWPENIQSWYELMWDKMPSSGEKDTDKINKVDTQMMNVVELALDCSGYTDKATNTYQLSNWLKNTETDTTKFYELCCKFFSALDIKETDTLQYLIPKWTENNRPIIPNYVCDNNDIVKKFYQPLLVFYASTLSKDDEWIRVIWNLVANIDLDRSSFKQAIKLIDELAEGMAQSKNSILNYLSSKTITDIKSCYKKAQLQLQEEICKASHIAEHPSIKEMEKYAFFRGAIRFLFTGADGNEDWGSFEAKAQNIKELIPVPAGERYTIKLLTPYISEQSLCKIYSENWVSNNDDNLRTILLDKESIPYLHNFLLKNDVKEPISLLHQDIMDLCEDAYGGRGYLQTRWEEESKYIWTNYVKRQGDYSWNSFIVGNESYKRISAILEKSFNIDETQLKTKIGDHIQGLYLNFKYQDKYLTLYGNNTICLMTDNWKEKMPNPNDDNGFYFSVEEIDKEKDLIKKVEEILQKKTDQEVHSQS